MKLNKILFIIIYLLSIPLIITCKKDENRNSISPRPGYWRGTNGTADMLEIFISSDGRSLTCSESLIDSASFRYSYLGGSFALNGDIEIFSNRFYIEFLYHSRIKILEGEFQSDTVCFATIIDNDEQKIEFTLTPSVLSIPTVSTDTIFDISQTGAICTGRILFSGNYDVIETGVCWNKVHTPTINDNKTTSEEVNVNFTCNLKALSPNTDYYVRTFATNRLGTAYGDEKSFKTLGIISGSVADQEGNTYKTITFGLKTWMAENLKATRYRNGDLIGTTDSAMQDVSTEIAPKYQWAYEGKEENAAIYGRLYTYHVLTDSRGVCPSGWHVSSGAEWYAMCEDLGGILFAGPKLKETGTDHWKMTTTSVTNEIGFNALPGGIRLDNGTYYSLGSEGDWWSNNLVCIIFSSARVLPEIPYMSLEMYIPPYMNQSFGLSVRCVKD